jgi:hypothetical protein
MEVANTLAYCDTATITAVKSFIVQAPCSLPSPGKLDICKVGPGSSLVDGEKIGSLGQSGTSLD